MAMLSGRIRGVTIMPSESGGVTVPRALQIASRDVSWRFLEKGSGDDVVVYLHGWMSGSGAWQPVMQRMKGPYRMLAPDLPGFGGTSLERWFDFSVPAYAAA